MEYPNPRSYELEHVPVGFLDTFCRHIVSLSWVEAEREPYGFGAQASDYDPKAFAISTFVICVRDIWFLVTAGHIFKDLEKRLQTGRRIVQSRLLDGLASRNALRLMNALA